MTNDNTHNKNQSMYKLMKMIQLLSLKTSENENNLLFQDLNHLRNNLSGIAIK